MSIREPYTIINLEPLEGTNNRYVSCQIARHNAPVGSDCITVAAAPLWMVHVLVGRANLYEEFVANAELEKEEVS